MKQSFSLIPVLLFGSLAVVFPLACDPAPAPGTATGGSGGDPADPMKPTGQGEGGESSACGELEIVGCDATCDDATPCGPGLHCKAGSCGADCQTNDDCGPEDECQADGICVPISNIKLDPQMTDPMGMGGAGTTCVEGEVEFEEVIPQVWLLLDRSGSMADSLDGVTRWDAVGRVLLGDPDDFEDRGVVGDFEDRVAFGATFYTSAGGGPTGCLLDLETIALARNNYDDIRHRYNQLGPTGGTPTAESVAAVVANASVTDLSGGPKILVLATDGVPGGCAILSTDPQTAVEQEVMEAYKKENIKTFAVSISTGTDASHMQRVANLGVGLPQDADPPAPYYTAESQEELDVAFSTILQDLPRSCTFSLNGEVDPENAGEGTVTLAGVELGYEEPDGWVLAQVDQVELVGAACDQIRAGEEDLDITFPCSVFTPIVK